MSDYADLIQKIAIFALPVLFAITVHEAAHAYAAKRYGDGTAFMLGRMTLNPLKHIDPVGTILLPLASLWLGGFLFGWARPVPVNFSALRNPKRDMRYVALAGPLANLLMAIGWALVYKLTLYTSGYFTEPLMLMASGGVAINVTLMVLNLIPIPPLDGGRILVSLLPPRQAYAVSRIEPYGMWILIALLFTGVLTVIMRPFQSLLYSFLNLFI